MVSCKCLRAGYLTGPVAAAPLLQAGRREVGDTTLIGYFTQHPPPVRPDLRIIDYLRWGPAGRQVALLAAPAPERRPACTAAAIPAAWLPNSSYLHACCRIRPCKHAVPPHITCL
jgi:hypothetical protein